MDMKPDEIVVRYRQAKKKSEQLKILAQLNDCTVDEIIDVLCEHSEYKRQYFNKAKIALKQQANKPVAVPEPPKAEPDQVEAEPIKEPEKIPPVIQRALKAGLEDLTEEIEVRRNRIEELEAEIAEFEKDIAALRAWEEEHV